MKLLLDELWPPSIAEQLRGRGVDAIAAKEPDQVVRYCNIDDAIVFERAQEDGRTVVTDNVIDFEPAREAGERERRTAHHGVVYALDPPFNRHKGDFVVGQMVRALDYFIRQLPPGDERLNRPHWLRPAPTDYE